MEINIKAIIILAGIILGIFGLVCLYALISYLIDFLSLQFLKLGAKFFPDFLNKNSHILFNEHYFTNDNKYLPLKDLYKLREEYAKKLQKYYINKKDTRLELENKQVRLKLQLDKDKTFLYCISKQNLQEMVELFLLSGDTQNTKAEVMTMWGIFDMEFTESSNLQNLYDLFGMLNPKRTFRGKKFYCSRPVVSTGHNYAISLNLNEEYYILCNKIRRSMRRINTDNIPKNMFKVKGDILVLLEIYSDKQLMQINDFDKLYDTLSKRNYCEVMFVDNNFKKRQEDLEIKLDKLKQNFNERNVDL